MMLINKEKLKQKFGISNEGALRQKYAIHLGT